MPPVAKRRQSRRDVPTQGRRRTYASSTELDGAYTADQVEFFMAIDAYKRTNNRPHPSWSEVLGVFLALGYRKVAEPEKAS